MVEVKNIEIFGLNRAINAIRNSFNVGEIDTTAEVPETDKKWNVAKALFGNKELKQSHNAASAGVLVQFELICNNDFLSLLRSFHFIEISELKNKSYFVTTNFRQLSRFACDRDNFKSSDFQSFVNQIFNKVPRFKELCRF